MRHSCINHRFTRFWQSFVVFTQSSIATQPSKCPFNYPSVRKDFESLDIIASLYDFQYPSAIFLDPTNQFASITTISPYSVSYTHLRAHETKANLVCRLLLEKK